MALALYSQVKGKAKQQLEILEIDDLEQDDGLDMMWRILDRSHEKMEHECADGACENLEKAIRKHAHPMKE